MTDNGLNQSLYDLVGADFFVRLVDAFYNGVETDQVLMALYPDGASTVGARWRLALFFIQYWGGPSDYMEERGHPRLRMRHNEFVIGPAERDRWLVHMAVAIETVVQDLDDFIKERATTDLTHYVVNTAESMRNHN